MLLQPGQNSEWRRYSWSPFTDWHYENGDRVVIDGDVARHERDGALIDVRPTTYVVETGEVEPVYQPPGTRSELFVEVRTGMALPINSVLANVSGPDVNEKYTFTSSQGTGQSFTLEELDALITKFQSNEDLHIEILAADWRSRNPDQENLDSTVGTLFTVNFAAETPFLLNRNE